MRLLETREHDGGLRARVERVAAEEDAVVITADLNEVNHSVQRFPSAAEYESARSSYCDEVRAYNTRRCAQCRCKLSMARLLL